MNHCRHRWSRFAVVSSLLLMGVLPGQEPPPPASPRPSAQPEPQRLPRSLADGLVRQRIEIDGLRPPHLDVGLEIGAGEGPLVLMVRRPDGKLEFTELDRGPGDHGKAPAPDRIDQPVEQAAAAPAPPPAHTLAVATVRIERSDDRVSVRAGVDAEPLVGESVAKERLQPLLGELLASRRASDVAGQLLLEVAPDATMQDVLTVCEVARAAGFTVLMFSGSRAGPIDDDVRGLLAALPAKFGWRTERTGPGGAQPMCDGELLVLFDGPARWADFVPLYVECAKIGIWRISFVGQRDAQTRGKLPANLPFDRGM